ncbi:MAG: hypothetical protein KatS3mg030_096 [Saprospiraceae bacterium]|nr:MAG: hypothetical protein KatS3mg030_096 [Saprospiraceae bacterium]
MITRTLKITPLFAIATAAMATSLVAIVYPSHFGYPFNRLNDYAIHIMLLCLGAGIACLLIRKPHYTFLFFGGCAVICLFLRNQSNGSGIDRLRKAGRQSPFSTEAFKAADPPHLHLAHINLADVNQADTLFKMLDGLDPQIISFQEVSPEWANELSDRLSEKYPFQIRYDDPGLHGMAIFSKNKIDQADTLFLGEVPVLCASSSFQGQDLRVFSYYAEPVLTNEARKNFEKQLYQLGEVIWNDSLPCILISTFTMVTWSQPVSDFCQRTGTLEGRKGFINQVTVRGADLLALPDDHIFYSPPFVLVFFSELIEPGSNNKIGFRAGFELNNDVTYVE